MNVPTKIKPSKQFLHAHQGHCDIDIASALIHLFGLKTTRSVFKQVLCRFSRVVQGPLRISMANYLP